MKYACPTASDIIFNVLVLYMFESRTSLLPFLTSVCSLGPNFLVHFTHNHVPDLWKTARQRKQNVICCRIWYIEILSMSRMSGSIQIKHL